MNSANFETMKRTAYDIIEFYEYHVMENSFFHEAQRFVSEQYYAKNECIITYKLSWRSNAAIVMHVYDTSIDIAAYLDGKWYADLTRIHLLNFLDEPVAVVNRAQNNRIFDAFLNCWVKDVS